MGVGAGVGAVVGAGVSTRAGAGVPAGATDGCATPGTREADSAGGVSPGVAAPAVPAETEPDAITADAKIPAVFFKGMCLPWPFGVVGTCLLLVPRFFHC